MHAVRKTVQNVSGLLLFNQFKKLVRAKPEDRSALLANQATSLHTDGDFSKPGEKLGERVSLLQQPGFSNYGTADTLGDYPYTRMQDSIKP